jgi:aminopeptidase YwaD
MTTHLTTRAAALLQRLCVDIDSRRVGSSGNRQATDFFANHVAAFGFEVEQPAFDCIDWVDDGVDLTVHDHAFAAFASPYSLGCQVEGPLAVVSTVEELVAADLAGRVLLLRGAIAQEQLMPKNFTFYNPEHHQRIIALLEQKAPAAIIAATGRNPELAGAVYPFPLIEDGDFDLPSVYMTDVEGERLAGLVGQRVVLHSRAARIPSSGCNVIARKGDRARRVVFFAHIDAKAGTPGAIDNATGVVILLLLAELLADYAGEVGVEIVALNGEDYYAASGEMQWLAMNHGRMEQIVLGVNMDGVGYRLGKTAYSLYNCPAEIEQAIRAVLATRDGMAEGDPWYQSDHGLFVYNGVPALAFTSDDFVTLWTEIAHTPRDVPQIVEPARLVEVAHALFALLSPGSTAFVASESTPAS